MGKTLERIHDGFNGQVCVVLVTMADGRQRELRGRLWGKLETVVDTDACGRPRVTRDLYEAALREVVEVPEELQDGLVRLVKSDEQAKELFG